jgi:hypothetical protein
MDNNLLCKLVGLTKKEPPLVAYLASLNSPLQTERYEEDEIYYDSYTKLGMSFLFDEPHEVLICIFLYAGGVDGFEEYKGDLPNSLSFSYTWQDILQQLGQPTEAGGNEYSDLIGDVIPAWVKYNIGDYILHITYMRDAEKISIISLMPLPKG